MERVYEGKKEDGTWEEFGWNLSHEPTADETGYVEVRAK